MPAKLDLTGQRFGRLTVTQELPERSREGQVQWLTKCDCGKTLATKGGPLRDGRTTSCGCLQRDLVGERCTKELVGKVFDRLTVVARSGSDEDGQALWLCVCLCGNETYARGGHLRSKRTRSCGCIRDEEWVKNPKRKPVIKYGAAHKRVTKLRGRAGSHPCHDCGYPAIDWSYQGGDPNELIADNEWKSPYSLDPVYYVPRCRLCHNHFDKAVTA